jgi:hypothetical protein
MEVVFMLTNWQELLEHLIPSFKKQRQAEELAVRAEIAARELSGLPPVHSNNRDVISVLKSTCLLLERFRDNPKLLNQKETTATQAKEVIETEEVESPPESTPVPQIVRATPEEKPTATAEELIKLRDWVLLAKSREGEDKASPQVLDAIYKQLGKILDKEGITSLEETGSFNYERQQVVSTQVTDDPDKDDLICDTVRPGYLFQGKLIRPQEAIVYTYDSSIVSSDIS